MSVMFVPATGPQGMLGMQGLQQIPTGVAVQTGVPMQVPVQMAAAVAGQQGMQQVLVPQMAGMQQMQYVVPNQAAKDGMGGMIQPMMIVPMMMQPDASNDSYVKEVTTESDEAPQSVDSSSASNTQRNSQQEDVRDWSPVLRASAQTPFERLAGAIAKRARQYPTVVVEGMGAESVGQIMRGLVLATSFMIDDNIIFSAQCNFVMCKSRPSLSFKLSREKSTTAGLPRASKVIVVNCNKVVGKVAGAMAKIVRCPSGVLRETRLQCGPSPGALNVAAKAVALARTMLGELGCDLKIIPVIPECDLPLDLYELVFELIPFQKETEDWKENEDNGTNDTVINA